MAYLDSIRFSFLYIDRYAMGRTWLYPQSPIPYNILRYIEEGEAEFVLDGKAYVVKKNDIVFIPKGTELSCQSLSERFVFYSVRFTSTDLNSDENVLGDIFHIPTRLVEQGEGQYFKELYHWARSNHVAKRCFLRGHLNLLIGSLALRNLPKDMDAQEEPAPVENINLEQIKLREKKSSRQIDSRIQVVTDFIILNPTKPYTPELLADMIGLSKQRFNALFKKSVGKSPMKYVKEMRLTLASKKLLIEDSHVNDIAYAVGYEDPNYFIREFKAAFGFTPNQYRKISRNG